MENVKTVSIEQMKDALQGEVGSKLPVKITMTDGETMVRFVRGFADQQTNILLISETSHSLSMKILEIRDIRTLSYAERNRGGSWKVLHAKWMKKNRLLAFLF